MKSFNTAKRSFNLIVLCDFNEGGDLQAAVEDYARKFGCYPSAVLAARVLSNSEQ